MIIHATFSRESARIQRGNIARILNRIAVFFQHLADINSTTDGAVLWKCAFNTNVGECPHRLTSVNIEGDLVVAYIPGSTQRIIVGDELNLKIVRTDEDQI